LDWNSDKIGSGEDFGASSGEILANEQPGHEWDAGGLSNAATGSQKGSKYGDDRAGTD
jgi:hypothetical protein